MNLIPWKRRAGEEYPMAGLREEMNRLFDSFWHGDFLPEAMSLGRGFPNVEVSETDTDIVVRADLPGMEAKDVDVSLSGDVLTIKGERTEEKEEKEKSYHHKEMRYGAFSRSLRLPATVDVQKISAECKKGVLKITLGKSEADTSKKITIEGD
jgi:HSP20 family protein